MKIYKLECSDQHGIQENNGHFLRKKNAQKAKKEYDKMPMNTKYGIVQSIIEIETED